MALVRAARVLGRRCVGFTSARRKHGYPLHRIAAVRATQKNASLVPGHGAARRWAQPAGVVCSGRLNFSTSKSFSSYGDFEPARIKLYFDGGSRGNPGTSGCGVSIKRDCNNKVQTIYQLSYPMGSKATNNEAEYLALILGLEEVHKRGVTKIECFGDSKLVVEQVNGNWKVKAEHLKELHAYIRSFVEENFVDGFTLEHVPREENREADAAASRAIDTQEASERVAQIWDDGVDLTEWRRSDLAPGEVVELPPRPPQADGGPRGWSSRFAKWIFGWLPRPKSGVKS